MKSGLKISGEYTMDILHADGSRSIFTQKNLIVDGGLELLAGVLAGTPLATNMEYLALGDGGSIPALGEKTLVSELRRDLATVTINAPDTNKVRFTVVHAKGDVIGTFREAGLFDGVVPGEANSTMFNRVHFDDKAVTVNDTLTEIWVISFTNKV